MSHVKNFPVKGKYKIFHKWLAQRDENAYQLMKSFRTRECSYFIDSLHGNITILQAFVLNSETCLLDRYLEWSKKWVDINEIKKGETALSTSLRILDNDRNSLSAKEFKHCRPIVYETVKLLLNHGADPNLGYAFHGSPLICAAYRKHDKVMKMLIDHGADINHQPYKNGLHKNLYFFRNSRDHERTIYGMNEYNSWEYYPTALYLMVEQNNIEMVNYLLSKGADIDRTSIDGVYVNATPLAKAIMDNNVEMFSLLKSCGANVDHVLNIANGAESITLIDLNRQCYKEREEFRKSVVEIIKILESVSSMLKPSWQWVNY